MKKAIFTIFTLMAFFLSNAQTTNPSPYCDGNFDDGAPNVSPVYDRVLSTNFGTLNNTIDNPLNSTHYLFFNNLAVPNLTIGNPYTCTTHFYVGGTCGYGIWIDYNHNNTFDANEKVGGSANATDYLTIGNNIIKTNNITIPTTAMTGNTRMRIRIVEDDNFIFISGNGALILPCNTSATNTNVMDWGETEDYVVNLVTGSSSVPVTSITVNSAGNATTVVKNNTLQMSAIVLPANATNSTITWSVQNGTGAATISSTGLLSATSAGTVTAKATANDGSNVFGTKLITILNPNSVNEIEENNKISFYPNPADDLITIENNSSIKIQKYEIVSLVGTKIMSGEFKNNTIDISTLGTGYYYLKLVSINNDLIIKNLIKK